MIRFLPFLVVLLIVLPLQADTEEAELTAPHAVVYLSADDSSPEGTVIKEGERILSQNGLTLLLSDGSHIELEAKTSVRLEKLSDKLKPDSTIIQIFRGGVRAQVAKQPRVFTIRTPTAIAGVRGTDFAVAFEPASATYTGSTDGVTEVDVYEGEIDLQSGEKSHRLRKGEGISASRKEVIKRKIKEKIKEKWEARREEIIDRVKKRYQLGDEPSAQEMQNILKRLPDSVRDEIKAKIQERMNKVKERIKARAAEAKRNAAAREAARDRRQEENREKAVKNQIRNRNIRRR